jgi:hypothetical protein
MLIIKISFLNNYYNSSISIINGALKIIELLNIARENKKINKNFVSPMFT